MKTLVHIITALVVVQFVAALFVVVQVMAADSNPISELTANVPMLAVFVLATLLNLGLSTVLGVVYAVQGAFGKIAFRWSSALLIACVVTCCGLLLQFAVWSLTFGQV